MLHLHAAILHANVIDAAYSFSGDHRIPQMDYFLIFLLLICAGIQSGLAHSGEALPLDAVLEAHACACKDHTADIEDNRILCWILFIIVRSVSLTGRELPNVERGVPSEEGGAYR
jgi:hypothetical protein